MMVPVCSALWKILEHKRCIIVHCAAESLCNPLACAENEGYAASRTRMCMANIPDASELRKSNNRGFQQLSWNYGCQMQSSDYDACAAACGSNGCCGKVQHCHGSACSGGSCCAASADICMEGCAAYFAAPSLAYDAEKNSLLGASSSVDAGCAKCAPGLWVDRPLTNEGNHGCKNWMSIKIESFDGANMETNTLEKCKTKCFATPSRGLWLGS